VIEGALAGLRVLDFSTLLPGPMATLLLAEAGAEVIKVERPVVGEEMRGYEPRWGRDSVNFGMLNRGKKSISVDLKRQQDITRLRPLIENCDILVEQFRPGVMARLGLGYEDVARINTKVIYCSITGYGQTGSKHSVAGHDLNYIGNTGLLALSLGSETTPVVPPALIADVAGGTYPAVLNILLALRQRDRTGTGAYLDIAMAENVFPFLYWAFGEGQATGRWPGNGDALVTGGSCRYRLYPTADGRFAAVAPLEEKFWRRFTEAIQLEPALRDDRNTPKETSERIADIIGGQTAAHWQRIFEQADCCCSIVQTVQEALDDPHFIERGLFARQLKNEDGATMIALPVPIATAFRPGTVSAVAPRLGEHNAELLDSRPVGGMKTGE
jgi:crotonobetainyl-CoA:carnitine CoA-transferase CaiB-like acyl-CoA transferase